MTSRNRRAPAAIEPSLDFTPVEREKQRHDGWTADRQRGFIAALARRGSVKAACASVGMSTEGAYYLRRQKGAEGFARAWARAQVVGIKALRDIAYERAVDGTPKGVWYKGERVGEERRYNDRLLMFMLRHEQPATYGEQKLLPRGTKHPDTVAREARWAAGDAEDAVFEDVGDPKADRVNELLDMYIAKAASERRARLDGKMSEADFILRQLTLFELVISIDAGPEMVDHLWPAALGFGGRGDKDKPEIDTSLINLLAAARRKAWADVGDPPRPDNLLWSPKLAHWISCGPTVRTRDETRKWAESQMSVAIAVYEATQTEDSWAAWNATPKIAAG